MYGLLVFVILALGFRLAYQVITDTLGIKIPSRVAVLVTVAIAVGVAVALDYSVFAAFGTQLRNSGLDYVATGVALVAGASAFDRVTGIFHGK